MEIGDTIQLLDTVVLLESIPDAGLLRGNVGTVVEVFEPPHADHVEVEFADHQGQTTAMLAVPRIKLLKLREEFRQAS